MAEQKRFEQKFLFNPLYAGPIEEILRHHCIVDNRHVEDAIVSVYFDTEHLDSFDDVIDGAIFKEKLRLRWYELSTDESAQATVGFFEVKGKSGFVGTKRRIKVPVTEELIKHPMKIETYMNDEYRSAIAKLGWRQPKFFSPVIQIKYQRIRFIEPKSGLQVALDTAIEVTAVNERLVPGSMPTKTTKAVLEIKGAEHIWPSALKSLETFPLRSMSFSKFAFCLDAARPRPELIGKWL
ncbi:MAG: VTC domain-containing protein [Proteobacteria bacterium]|nr:VTC domain-containing protein [Pseudomonadota bacterium]